MEEDKSLMQAFKAGSNDSFEKLVIKYRQRAISFCISFVHDYYIAEDIAQECFAYIYVYKEKYCEKYSFTTYLFTILRNKCIDYTRKNHDMPVDKIPEKTIEETESIVLKKEQRKIIKAKINNMKEDYKTVIYLIDYYEFSYKETAEIMGKSIMQIKILIFRARQKLKLLLEEEE